MCLNVNGMYKVYCMLKLEKLTDCTKKNAVLEDDLFVGRSVSFKVNGFEGGKYVRMFTICSMHVHKTKKITK